MGVISPDDHTNQFFMQEYINLLHCERLRAIINGEKMKSECHQIPTLPDGMGNVD